MTDEEEAAFVANPPSWVNRRGGTLASKAPRVRRDLAEGPLFDHFRGLYAGVLKGRLPLYSVEPQG